MYNTDTPQPTELPSSRALLRSTLIAAGVALLLLVTVVLPAEYGVDHTGVGRVLGLTQMGEIKQQLAAEAAEDAAADSLAAASGAGASEPESAAGAPVAATGAGPGAGTSGSRADTIRVSLQPGQGREVKLVMAEGARVNFHWSSEPGVVNYDLHADRDANPKIRYHEYKKGQALRSDEGVLVAAFEGEHGWFWRNRTAAPVTVTLRTSGSYSAWKEVK